MEAGANLGALRLARKEPGRGAEVVGGLLLTAEKAQFLSAVVPPLE